MAESAATRLGRVVFIAQWPAVVLLPLLVAFGRLALGLQPGWGTMLTLVFGGWLVVILLAVAPIICVASGSIRRSRTAPFAYSVATVATWVLALLFGLFFVDTGDSWGPNAVAMTIFGIEPYSPGMEVIEAISSWLLGLTLLAWLVSIVLLIASLTGIGRSRHGKSGHLAAGGLVALLVFGGTVSGMTATSPVAASDASFTAPASGVSPIRDHDRVVVYYQKHFADGSGTYISPAPLVTEKTGVDVVNLAAVHMNADALLLNDDLPSAALYDTMWAELARLQDAGVAVIGMIGGAQNSTWDNLQLDYATQYPRLREFVSTYRLDGIDLDIETPTTLTTVVAVIDDLRADFGADFTITMSPVAPALAGDDENLSGFDYDELYRLRGTSIDWFNAQFYCGWGEPNSEYYDEVLRYQNLEGAGIPATKIVMAAVTNPDNCAGWVSIAELQGTLRSLAAAPEGFGGVAGWEYFNSLPGGEAAPWEWAAAMRSALDAPTRVPSSQAALADTGLGDHELFTALAASALGAIALGVVALSINVRGGRRCSS